MYQANYHRPSSVSEAVSLLKANEDATVIAGGHTLIPTMKQRLAAPTDLIDLRRVPELRGITREGDHVVIGAMTTHAEVASDETVKAVAPGLAKLAGAIGDPAVRHLGTIGGSVANNDPAADYPAALLALDGVVVTDTRGIPAAEFFTGLYSTALDEGEIVTAIKVAGGDYGVYAKFHNPASRYAIVGVFVARKNGEVRVAVTGAGEDGVFRHAGLEAALTGDFRAEACDGVEVSPKGLMTDMHASADYRANLIRVMAKRAAAGEGGRQG